MDAVRRSAVWDEVWASYDAGQGAGRTAAPPPTALATAPTRPRRAGAWRVRAGRRWWALALVPVAWLALPWVLAARISDALAREDGPGLIRHLDGPSARESLRSAMGAAAGAGESEGARRYLAATGDRMAAAWERPGEVSAWMALRARGGRPEGGLVPAAPLRAARPTGPTGFRLAYGPAEGGVVFDVAWRGDGFRVTGVSFPGALPAAPTARQLAMR